MGLGSPLGRGSGPIAAVGAPLAILVLAYVLWAISDRLLVIGPFDRTQFGWIVVIPLWLAAPIVAGLAWRSRSRRDAAAAAATLGVVLTVVSGWLIWQSVANPGCEYGSAVSQQAWAVRSAVVAATLGAAVVASAWLTRQALIAGSLWRGVTVGLASSAVAFVLPFFVGIAISGFSASCNRPPLL